MKIFDGSAGHEFLDWIIQKINAPIQSMDDAVRQNMAKEILALGGHELVAQPSKPKKEVNIIDEVLDNA